MVIYALPPRKAFGDSAGTRTSFDVGKVREKDLTLLPVPSLPLSHWTSQLFDLRAPSSTDVPVLLLNQPNGSARELLNAGKREWPKNYSTQGKGLSFP